MGRKMFESIKSFVLNLLLGIAALLGIGLLIQKKKSDNLENSERNLKNELTKAKVELEVEKSDLPSLVDAHNREIAERAQRHK